MQQDPLFTPMYPSVQDRGYKCVYSVVGDVLGSLYTKASKRVYRFMYGFRPPLASLSSSLFCSYSSASG
jgi:hypothetical protein